MKKKLYVGNLPFEMNDVTLKTLCEEGGRRVMSSVVLMERETGRSRGFGFVEFENEADARSALESLDGRDLGGRSLVVNEAREKTNDGGFRSERSGGPNGRSSRW
jgi:RNA recognition motif-containing protein